jgi:hypothetical protein
MRLRFSLRSVTLASAAALGLLAPGACSSKGGFAEAQHPALPKLVDQGEPVLTAPAIVSITFPGDPDVAAIEQFGRTLAQSGWWDTVRAGYCETNSSRCVGDGPAGTSVEIAAPPGTSYADANDGGPSTLQDYITALLTSGVVPPPTGQSILVFYFPASTLITFQGGTSCTDFDGYHNSMSFQGTRFAFVVVPECTPTRAGLATAQFRSFAASHEIIEAATDPFLTPSSAGFYLDFSDPAIIPWNDLGGGESADMCLDLTGLGQDEAVEGGFTVQRVWSNAEAAAGHDPCVPETSSAPYFNVAPQGAIVAVDVGGTVTFDAVAFSDGPRGDWYVEGVDANGTPMTDANPYLTIKVNGATLTTTNNGGNVSVSATLNQDPAPLIATTGFAGATGVLVSADATMLKASKAAHVWPFLVTTPAGAKDAGLPVSNHAPAPRPMLRSRRAPRFRPYGALFR